MQDSINNSGVNLSKNYNSPSNNASGNVRNELTILESCPSSETSPPPTSSHAYDADHVSSSVVSSPKIKLFPTGGARNKDSAHKFMHVRSLSLKDQGVEPYPTPSLHLASYLSPSNTIPRRASPHYNSNPYSNFSNNPGSYKSNISRQYSLPDKLNYTNPQLNKRSNPVYTSKSDVFSSLIPIKVMLSNNIELEEVTLRKKDLHNDFLGLMLEVFPETIDSNAIVSISRITPGGLCYKDARLKKYDRILKINGYRVKEFEGVLEQLRKNCVTLTVARATDRFLGEHIKSFTCSLFPRRHTLRPSRAKTFFENGPPRIVYGVDEEKLEIEMIIFMRRVEKIRKGKKKEQHDLYNLDDDEYFFANHEKSTVNKMAKRRSFLLKNQHVRTSDGYRVLDEPFRKSVISKQISTPLVGSYPLKNAEHLYMRTSKPPPHYYQYCNNISSRYSFPYENGYYKSYAQQHPTSYSRSLPFNYPSYHNGYLPPQKLQAPPSFSFHRSPYMSCGYSCDSPQRLGSATNRQIRLVGSEQSIL